MKWRSLDALREADKEIIREQERERAAQYLRRTRPKRWLQTILRRDHPEFVANPDKTGPSLRLRRKWE